ncbi:MAG: multicopper oxidase domain-containing protein [Rhodopila sp.]
MPGPTLRARVGDLIQLTLLNQIGLGAYWNSIDRGEKGQGCDVSVAGKSKSGATINYPGLDRFPDCFHGSSTGNIHFHGTHTNPNATGDNVFIEVRPSLRDEGGKPVVTEASVKQPFDEFFARCETELAKSVLSEWPHSWDDMPRAWVERQEALLKQYDADPVIRNKLWPVDAYQLSIGAWPQYYIGAVPYCFRLPAYTATAPAPHAGGMMHAHMSDQPPPSLQMGQAPGTHWYHAHKHGSTTIDVENGMAGAFIIEGGYDDALNAFYGAGEPDGQPWTRSQPVLVVNQMGVSTNLFGGNNSGGGPLPFTVNGRSTPVITMQPGQVQMWRIVNAATRGSVFLNGFAPATTPAPTTPSVPQAFAWRQTAQDGVQFKGVNYNADANANRTLMIAPGNRADLLIKAPTAPGRYVLLAQQVRSRCSTLPTDEQPAIVDHSQTPPPTKSICPPDDLTPLPFLYVTVDGKAAAGNQAKFIPAKQLDASFPPFLADIPENEVKATKTVVFESTPTGGSPAVMHKIDGREFDGDIGQVVLLNTVEEWKIVNNTVNGGLSEQGTVPTDPPGVVDHPFHIHINPFQVVEFFDPNEVLPPDDGLPARPKYVFSGTAGPGQCLLDPDKPDTWKPCDRSPRANLIWWDVFPIPSARAVFLPVSSGTPSRVVVVPGYFKMRSRFVDYPGQYVMHCHILAHEDRGMMSVVEVVPYKTPMSHE